MSEVPWPWRRRRGEMSPFVDLQGRINRMFEDAWSGFDLAPFAGAEAAGEIQPRVDVSETDSEIEIKAELPGVEEKDVEVTMANGRITLKGEKKSEKEEKKKGYHLVERSWGSFQRSFQLPDGVDAAKAKASFDKGVLTVSIPKTEKAKQNVKKIAIGKKT